MNENDTTPAAPGTPNGVIVTLTRVFQFGSLRLPDPDPTLPPREAVRLYAPNYPILAAAELGEPEVQGDELVYAVVKETVKTKGGDRA